jgi:predicted GNAT family acetyltransferase
MQIDLDKILVIDNQAERRYEAQAGGHLAKIDYILDEEHIVYTRTLVPEELGSQGLASKMARTALEDARARGLKVIPQCPFVAAYVEKHPEYQSLVWDPHSAAE